MVTTSAATSQTWSDVEARIGNRAKAGQVAGNFNTLLMLRVKELATGAVKRLMANGGFFSRPYGESTGIIVNSDAATVAALHKVKSILDPDHIMNPGKLCF